MEQRTDACLHPFCSEDAITREWVDNAAPYIQLDPARDRQIALAGRRPILVIHRHDDEEKGDES